MTETVLITGGAGFFGRILKSRLLADGFYCVSIDLQDDPDTHASLKAVRGDICDRDLLDRLLAENTVDVIFHCAAALAHTGISDSELWRSNVEGTRAIADAAARHGVPKVVFTSSNCLWAHNFGRPVTEGDRPQPVEIYGRSKAAGEDILRTRASDFESVILRCPTIVDEERLGLLAILFEFIAEGRRVWVVGGGRNRYQFIYGRDLADAAVRSASYNGSNTFNVGSDGVRPLGDVYRYVIDQARTGARVATLPKAPTLVALRLAHMLRMSPLGPYHYRMIAEDFVFDTSRVKAELGWAPTLTNEQMLHKAYDYYLSNKAGIERRNGQVSAHRQTADMGAIRLLKWLS